MARDYDFYVYMTTNYAGTVLYIGVTSDLEGRVWEHQHGEGSKFTGKYHADRLLYYEHFGDVHRAIAREKQLKGWTRAKKEALIRTVNPNREDITYQLDRDWRPTVEGPSAALHSAQDDRNLIAKVHEGPTVEGLASPVLQTRLSAAFHSAHDDEADV